LVRVQRKGPPPNIKAWLLKVLRNQSINAGRKKSRESRAYRRLPIPPTDPSPGDGAEQEALRGAVRKTVRSLPFKYQEAVALRYVAELSVKEIADVLQQSESTVKTRLSRARRRVGKLLLSQGWNEEMKKAPSAGGRM